MYPRNILIGAFVATAAACGEATAPSPNTRAQEILKRASVPHGPSFTYNWENAYDTAEPTEFEASGFCPSSGRFPIWVGSTKYGPYLIDPLWVSCRDFYSGEKYEINQFYWQVFWTSGCADLAMEMYAMVNASIPRMRVGQGYGSAKPHFPSPFADQTLNGSTHAPGGSYPVDDAYSIVAEEAMSGIPGESFLTILHEALHALDFKNNSGLTEQDVLFGSSYCYNGS